MLIWRANCLLVPSTTYTLVLRPPRKDGLCPVHLRLTSERQPLYRAVPDVAVGELQHDIERRRRAGHPRTAEEFVSIRRKLQSFRLGIQHPKGRNSLRNEPAELQARRAAVTLPFAQLTVRPLRDYEIYPAGLGNRETTLNKELSSAKAKRPVSRVETGLLAFCSLQFKKILRCLLKHFGGA